MRKINQKGQSLFEIVIVIGVVVLVVMALIYGSTVSIRNSSYSSNRTVAFRYTQEAMEWLRNQRDSDFDVFYAYATADPVSNIYCLNNLDFTNFGTCSEGEVIAGTMFKREVEFTTSDPSGPTEVKVTVSTYWDDGQGEHEVPSSTVFTDWRQM